MKLGTLFLFAAMLMVSFDAIATTLIDKDLLEPPVIDSEQVLGQCLEQVQRQYFPLCLPSLSERLLQPAGSFPVIWGSFSPETRRQFQGYLDANGIVKYSVGLYQDYWSDEIVVMDANSGRELFRIPREKGYDKFDLQREVFGKVLEDEYTRNIFLPAKISTLVDLIPLVFWDAHVQLEQEAAATRQAESLRYATEAAPEERTEVSVGMALVPVADGSSTEGEPLAMAPPPPGGDGGGGGGSSGGGSTSNQAVELTINLPPGFGHMGHIEIFTKDDLIYSTSWSGGDNWVPTFGSQTVEWVDPASTNKMKRYYYIGDGTDSDGDGYSNLWEAWVEGSNSNSFNAADLNSNGINDWWDEKIFGQVSTNQALMDDTDGDGLTNYMEIAVDSLGRIVAMASDPNRVDSDADGLDDWAERMVWHTGPMNPDTDSDGLNDAAEINASPQTDPRNPDISAPLVVFSN